jgi:hypothetical protein
MMSADLTSRDRLLKIDVLLTQVAITGNSLPHLRQKHATSSIDFAIDDLRRNEASLLPGCQN